jgi:hypothetical protein
MEKTMRYALYKQSYSEFPAHDYDARKKTIVVNLPDVKRPKLPSEWYRNGNHYFTPGGTVILFWNTDLAENFRVEHGSAARTIPAGLYSRQKLIETVNEFDAL